MMMGVTVMVMFMKKVNLKLSNLHLQSIISFFLFL